MRRPKIRFRVRNDGEPAGDPPPDKPVEKPAEGAGSDIQARIDAIYGAKKAAEESLSEAVRENTDLRARLIAAEERLALSTRSAGGSTTQGSGSPTFTPQGSPAQSGDELGTIKAQLAQLTQNLERQRLEDQQVAALNKAKTLFPGLAAGDKTFVEATKEIFARDEMLRRHPQGPMLAAALAAQLRGPVQGQPSQEKIAGLSTPTPSPLSAMDQSTARKQLETLTAEAEAIKAKMRLSGGSDHWAKFQEVRVQIGELEKKLKG